jgi:flagellin
VFSVKIATNIPALTASITLRRTNNSVLKTMQKLSTGIKINSASDDAAGLAISNKLSTQVTGLNRASLNASDGISLVQTADGALSTVTDMLQRMRELAVQAASDVLMPGDKAKLQAEIDQLVMEINDSAFKTEFNQIKLLNGEANRMTRSRVGISAPQNGPSFADSVELENNTFPGDTIVSILHSTLPEGYLEYQIDEAGRPPVVMLNRTQLEQLAANSETLIINELRIEFTPDDDWDSIRAKMAGAANPGAFQLKYKGDDMYLATVSAGSGRQLRVTSTSGTVDENEFGTDAKLSNVKFINRFGVKDANFDSAMGVLSDGNDVTIIAADGLTVGLGIRVYFDPTIAGNFVYGNGSYTGDYPRPTDPPGTLPGGAPSGPYANGYPIDTPVVMHGLMTEYGNVMLQVGANYNQNMAISIPRTDSESLGFVEYVGGRRVMLLDYTSLSGATRAISAVDDALAKVTSVRANLGAYQNRLDQTVTNLDNAAQNTETSRSRIQDTDMAEAMTKLTQENIRYQAGIAILAQANQRPEQVLSLMQ